MHVAGDEDARRIGLPVRPAGDDAAGTAEADLLQQRTLLGAVEADREQDEVRPAAPARCRQISRPCAGRPVWTLVHICSQMRGSWRSLLCSRTPRPPGPRGPRPRRRRRTPSPPPRTPARRPPRGPGSRAGSTARSATGRGHRRVWTVAAGRCRAGSRRARPAGAPRRGSRRRVSPPPMMTTCLPGASMGASSEQPGDDGGWTRRGGPWPDARRAAPARVSAACPDRPAPRRRAAPRRNRRAGRRR